MILEINKKILVEEALHPLAKIGLGVGAAGLAGYAGHELSTMETNHEIHDRNDQVQDYIKEHSLPHKQAFEDAIKHQKVAMERFKNPDVATEEKIRTNVTEYMKKHNLTDPKWMDNDKNYAAYLKANPNGPLATGTNNVNDATAAIEKTHDAMLADDKYAKNFNKQGIELRNHLINRDRYITGASALGGGLGAAALMSNRDKQLNKDQR